MPTAFIFAAVAGPMPWNLPTGSASTKGGPHLGRDDEQAIGLALVGGELRQELVVRHAGGGGQAGLDAYPGADLLGDLPGVWHALQIVRYVQIGLVQRERLHEAGVLREDAPDLERDFLVDVEAGLHEDQLRTLPLRRDRRHGGAHPSAPQVPDV